MPRNCAGCAGPKCVACTDRRWNRIFAELHGDAEHFYYSIPAAFEQLRCSGPRGGLTPEMLNLPYLQADGDATSRFRPQLLPENTRNQGRYHIPF
jgi:hypothetical protein